MAAKIFRINYKSDFILTMNSDAGWAIPFCIKFWTSVPSRAYFVGFDGTTYTHCAYDPSEPTKLVVQFDDHHLPIGDLNYQIAYHFTVADFPNDTEDEVINPAAITTEIDGETYHVMLDFTGETAPEIEFSLPAYANEAERIQNELQRQQNEAARIAAELQREQATAAAVQGAENVNAQLNGTTLTVTNRQGVSTSVNTKGEQGEQGPVGPEGPQGETGISIVSFTPKSETSTTLIYTVTFSDGHTQDVAIPKGPKGDTGATGPQGPQGDTGVSITGFVETGETETATLYNITFSNGTTQQVSIPKGEKGDQGHVGPQGPQGPMGDVAVITPEQQAAFTMYSVPGQNTDGPMTQKAVTDAFKLDVRDGIHDLDFCDESGYVIISLNKGHVATMSFNSKDVSNLRETGDDSDADLNIGDESGNVIVQFKDGHIATKNFNSRYAGGSNSYAKLRFANWNIAHFNLGAGITNSIDTEEKYNTYLPVYRKIFNDVNADFLSICEFESPFWKNHPAYTTKSQLFPNYKYYKDNATTTSNGNWVAFFSHLPLSNVTEVPFNNYPSGAYRYYLVGDMIISGKTVKVVCTHLTHDTSGSGGSNAYAPLQIEQLISDFQDYQNVVMLADWNTGPAGFQPFKDTGYTMANNDFLGTLQTSYITTSYAGAMDNIVCKGGSINNINVVNVNDRGAGILSDHYLIYCDIVFE